MHHAIVEADGLVKVFGKVRALDGLTSPSRPAASLAPACWPIALALLWSAATTAAFAALAVRRYRRTVS